MTQAVAGFLAAGFLVMVLLGYFVTVLVCPREISNKLAWAMAPVVGMGICSIIFFLFRRPMFTVEVSLLIGLFGVWLRYRKRTSGKLSKLDNRTTILAVWLAGVMAWVTLASFIWVGVGPHGDWDGWAIWNAHARYLYRAGPVWRDHIKDTAHPDYPLLLPAATARLWRYIGKDVPEAGGVQTVLITLSGVTILAASLWELRGASVSYLVPLLLLGSPFYLILGISQYADVPLAVYILSTIALLCLHWKREPEGSRIMVLAGFTTGCAGWTKNEGLIFIAVTTIAILLPIFRRPAVTMRQFGLFAIGMLLPLAVTIYFKVAVPAPNDLVANLGYATTLAKVTDFKRYVTIATAFLDGFWSAGKWPIHPGIPLMALLAVCGIDRRLIRDGGWLTGAAILVAMLLTYFGVYLITPLPLEYHIPTSLNRLLMHLWPSFLFLAGLMARISTPEVASRHEAHSPS